MPVCLKDRSHTRGLIALASVLALLVLGLGILIRTSGREGWIVINAAGFFVAAWLSVLPHELCQLCHALAALLVGLRVHGIVWGSGPVMVRGVLKNIPYRVHFFPRIGVTYAEVRDGSWFRFQRLATLLAGPASHVLMLWTAIVIFRDAWHTEGPSTTFSPVTSFLAANALLLYGSLYPHISKATGIPSDGKQILSLLSPSGMRMYEQWEGAVRWWRHRCISKPDSGL